MNGRNRTQNGTTRRSDSRALFDLAGVDPRAAPTLKDLALIRVRPVKVEIVGKELRSAYSSAKTRRYDSYEAPDNRDLLEAFTAMKTAKDVASFVRQYGWLWLCRQHGIPSCFSCHGSTGGRWSSPDGGPDEGGITYYFEPIDGYLFLSTLACALIRLGSSLRFGELGDSKDWQIVKDLVGRLSRENRPVVGFALRVSFYTKPLHEINGMIRRQIIADILGDLVNRGHYIITPTLHLGWIRGEEQIKIRIATDTMAAISLKLMAAISLGGYVACHGCQCYYERSITDRRRTKHFCETCRTDGTAERIRKRDQRARKRRGLG